LYFNSPNHFLSLSDNSEIVEFLFVPEEEKMIEIEKFHLKRPNNDLLKQNGHMVKHLKHGHYHKITRVLQFENFLILGYDDGLILVYQIAKKKFEATENQIEKETKEAKGMNNDDKKNEEEEENEEIVEDNENEENDEKEENKKSNIKTKEEKNKNQIENNIEEKRNNKHKLDYFNSFSLYYILLGHIEEILSLCYIPELKILISSSIDHTIKIFDFTTGQMTHYFKFDFIINRILYQNISKKGEPKIVLTLLSQSPIKVIINLSTNPIMMNTHHFEHINIDQFEKINDKYYGMNSKNIKIFDKNLELEGNLVCLSPINLIYFYKYKNDFFIVDNENMVRIVTFNLKTKNKKI
jgi:WD40 repeat protein